MSVPKEKTLYVVLEVIEHLLTDVTHDKMSWYNQFTFVDEKRTRPLH